MVTIILLLVIASLLGGILSAIKIGFNEVIAALEALEGDRKGG